MKKIFLIIFLLFSFPSFADNTFWSDVDKFLGEIADGVSKKDAITGLRTFDNPFHNEESYRQMGKQTLDWMITKARSEGVTVYSEWSPRHKRVRKILERLVPASHYRNHEDKVKFKVIDYQDFNAFAFGGGYFVVFSGLMDKTNDDELAYVIAHELAHNTAGHIEENYFLRVKDAFGNKATNPYAISYKNINEQEADRIAIIYTALAGYNPRASATIWQKQPQGIEQYTFYRTHPANPERVRANDFASNIAMKYYIQGQVNPNVESVLKCNELFCNHSGKEELKDGEGGGLAKTIEVLGDYIIKNQEVKKEQKLQQQEIAKANKILLETPPKLNWHNSFRFVYEGKINRHNQVSGNSFGLSQNLQVGKFFYNFNGNVIEGNLAFYSQNQNGYWFRWTDKWGQGFVNLQEYTDGSLRGNIYMDDGTNPGKLMGQFGGKRVK